ncbi:MAG: hypothetical protein H6658_17800 [Ardenticatenaceae bacterium]|nr:hypothetical protein [Ardenticatenaceae bacterium]
MLKHRHSSVEMGDCHQAIIHSLIDYHRSAFIIVNFILANPVKISRFAGDECHMKRCGGLSHLWYNAPL